MQRIFVPVAFSLVLLTASVAQGQQLFNNFPVNGQISAFQINAGYTFSNSFTLTSTGTIGEIEFGAWLTTGDSVTGVTWSIGTAPFGATSGSGVAGATSSYNLSNADGFDVDTVSFAIPGLTLPAGTYYLTLSAAVSAGANPVYWDINDGASVDSWDSTYGHVSASNTCFQTIGISGTCASSFELLSTNTAVTALPTSLTFSNQNVGTTSTAQGATITNNGPGVATINGIGITGANPGDFAQTNTCPISPATLAANASCTVAVTFTPTAGNARSAAITITGSSPLSVGLSGTGVLVPSTVTLLPTSVSFPNQIVSTTSGTQAITVTNSGPSPLTITSIAVTGTNPGDFAQTNNCPVLPTTIAVNGSCTINVKFIPQAANLRSAAITITDNGVSSPQSVGLSGTGIPVPTWSNGYTYEATFTVAAGQVPSTQTNFPALISGTYADFATTANGGRINNTCTQTVGNNATTVPCDLIFTSDSAGTMPLSWEFETYTATTGAANIWVNAPNLGNGTVIYAWYGQPSVTTLQTTPSAAWSSNFLAVYHLKENPAGTAPQMNDSTANGNNATMNGTVLATQQQPGEIDGSVNFEGNTWASLGNPNNFSFERTESFSVSGWFKLASNSAGTLISKFPGPPTSLGWALLQYTGSSSPTFSLGLFGGTTTASVNTPAVTVGAWHYVVATYAGTSTVAGMNIYVDGVNQPLTTLSNNLTTSILNTVTPAAINGRGGAVQMSTDSMDEIRISTTGVVFTPAYVTASFNNQSKPGTFFTAVTGLINAAGASLSPSPSSVSFPNQNVNTTSASQAITLTNNGPGTATIGSIAITGTDPGDFAQTNNCPVSPATLAANAFCTINVTFTPLAANPRSAAIGITGSNPLSVGLSGTGTAVPSTVTLAPTSISFPNQTVNTTSGAQAITVTNSGPNPLAITSIAVTGTNPGDFAQTNNCPVSPTTIAVNGFCTINVTFTPAAANARSAAITITDNGAASPQSVGVSGTGTAVVIGPQPWPNGYNYQATFTVAAGQVPSSQTNFPALISGTFADFATTASGGRINNTCTQTVGDNATTVPCDLIFTSDSAGTMPLSWEFETYTATTGAANIWVNAPNLGNGTVIYAWYGQPSVTTLQTTPSATWSSNFLAVYHLKENPAGAAPQMNDSTANGNNATMNGTVLATQQQPGEIDGGINFEGNTWASLANPNNFSFERTESFSVSGWFKLVSNSAGTLISKFPGPPTSLGWGLLQYTGSSSPTFSLGLFGGTTTASVNTPAVTVGAWHYVVATYAGTSTVAGMNIYVDGVNQPLTTLSNNLTTSILNSVTPAAINGRGGAVQMSTDSMDEIRISTTGVVFTSAYVTASFNNQSKPGTFFSVVTGLTN